MSESESSKKFSNRGTVLVVEDVHYMRLLVRQTIAAMGYEVLEARSGEQGIELFSQQQSEIQLILLDIVMPGLDGIETLQEIRKIDPKIPVLMVTANPNKDNLMVCAKHGISGFVSKPFDRNKFRAKVLEVLATSQADGTAKERSDAPSTNA
jgi:CheY-like chemotaxis protein